MLHVPCRHGRGASPCRGPLPGAAAAVCRPCRRLWQQPVRDGRAGVCCPSQLTAAIWLRSWRHAGRHLSRGLPLSLPALPSRQWQWLSLQRAWQVPGSSGRLRLLPRVSAIDATLSHVCVAVQTDVMSTHIIRTPDTSPLGHAHCSGHCCTAQIGARSHHHECAECPEHTHLQCHQPPCPLCASHHVVS